MKNKKVILILCILILIAAIGVTLYFGLNRKVEVIQQQESDYHTIVHNGEEYEYNSSITTILLLGIDSEEASVQGQSDAIELLVIDRENKRMKVLSISRDTMSEIRLFDAEGNDLGWHEQHINLAYAYGSNPQSGCMYSMQAISRMLGGIPIVHYAALNMDMLPKVQNLVGPIQVIVPNDSTALINPEWTKGAAITIHNNNVESFLRSRDTGENYSNEDRMQRQKAYMEAFQVALKDQISNNFNKMVSEMFDVVQDATSNIGIQDIETFANMLLTYEFDSNTDMIELKGENVSGAYHDEFHLDKEALNQLVVDLFYKKK